MALLTPEGARIPANTDLWNLLTDLTKMVDSQRTVIPVASRAAAEVIATNMGTDGRPVSDTNPLVVYREDTGIIEVKVTAGWVSNAPVTYTPALTALTTNPTLGAGSSQLGSYSLSGKIMTGAFFVAFGTSGSAIGSGAYMVSLPPGFTYNALGSAVPLGNFTAKLPSGLAISGFLTLSASVATTMFMTWQSATNTQSQVQSGTSSWGSGTYMAGNFTIPVQ